MHRGLAAPLHQSVHLVAEEPHIVLPLHGAIDLANVTIMAMEDNVLDSS